MRKNYRKNPPITKEELTSLYNELKSIAKIGIKIGVNTVTIFNWMKYYEIPRIKNNKNPYFKGKKIPKESVLKMRKSLKKYYETHNNHRKGVKASLETRQKQSIAHKGKIPWNKDLHNEKTRLQMLNAVKSRIGVPSPKRGIFKKKICQKCGKEYIGAGKKYCSRMCRDLTRIKRVTRTCVFCGKEYSTIDSQKKNFCSIPCRNLWLFMHKVSHKPTKPELIMESIIKEHNLPFKYTGKTIINRKFAVDFLSFDGSTAIEVFGCYWHACPEHFSNEELYEKNILRLNLIEAYGIKVIVVWEHELNNKDNLPLILKRIKNNVDWKMVVCKN